MPFDLFLWTIGLFGLGALLMVGAHARLGASPQAKRREWIKFCSYFVIVHGMLLLAALGRVYLGFLWLGLGGVAALEIQRNSRTHPHSQWLSLSAFTLLVLGIAHLFAGGRPEWLGHFCFLFITVALTDSYAQLCGRLSGRHAMCPSVSPNKTWEGFAGGCAFGTVGGAFIGRYAFHIETKWALVLAAWTVLWAVAGDLVFSFWKRQSGIKDFSRLLPGHGGVLDRFDSLVVAAPALFWLRWFLAV